MKTKLILNYFDELFELPKCELNYNKDYELLIATVLSAQCTDKRVNIITKVLFEKYKTLDELGNADIEDIKKVIKSCGQFHKKSEYIKDITHKLLTKHNAKVPNDRNSLEKMNGVGRKTTNVVLSVLYNEDLIAVDTHVERVSKRLNLASENDKPYEVEKKLMKAFPKDKWSRLHHQMVLFGRYNCAARNPKCEECKLKNICGYKNKR